jgi:cephalosporin-C deacetylase-like acetyl esterase
LTRVSSNRAVLDSLKIILDGYRAFDVLANHPRIDPVRIALMGFSLGGLSAAGSVYCHALMPSILGGADSDTALTVLRG